MTAAAALGPLQWARRIKFDRPGQDRIVVLGLAPVPGAPLFWPALTLGGFATQLERESGRPLLDVFSVAHILDRDEDPTRGAWARRRGRSVQDHLRGRRVVALGLAAWRLVGWPLVDSEPFSWDDDAQTDPEPFIWNVEPSTVGPPRVIAMVPNPSRSPAWNSPGIGRRARSWWAELAELEAARLGVPRDRRAARRAVYDAVARAGVAAVADLAAVAASTVRGWSSGAKRPNDKHAAALERVLDIPAWSWDVTP